MPGSVGLFAGELTIDQFTDTTLYGSVDAHYSDLDDIDGEYDFYGTFDIDR